MAQVSLRINGYAYVLGCADGEEPHLRALAADLDQRVDAIKASAGPSGEGRLLLMAALMLADELFELRRAGGSPDELRRGNGENGATPPVKAGRRLTRAVKQAEAIADAMDPRPPE